MKLKSYIINIGEMYVTKKMSLRVNILQNKNNEHVVYFILKENNNIIQFEHKTKEKKYCICNLRIIVNFFILMCQCFKLL